MKTRIQIELTEEQKQQIQQATGKKLSVVELKPEVLEERIELSLMKN